MTPMKAIRAKCLDCCCGQCKEVKLCPCEDCPLHPYRFGKNPARKGIGGKNPDSFKKLPTQLGDFEREAAKTGGYIRGCPR